MVLNRYIDFIMYSFTKLNKRSTKKERNKDFYIIESIYLTFKNEFKKLLMSQLDNNATNLTQLYQYPTYDDFKRVYMGFQLIKKDNNHELNADKPTVVDFYIFDRFGDMTRNLGKWQQNTVDNFFGNGGITSRNQERQWIYNNILKFWYKYNNFDYDAYLKKIKSILKKRFKKFCSGQKNNIKILPTISFTPLYTTNEDIDEGTNKKNIAFVNMTKLIDNKYSLEFNEARETLDEERLEMLMSDLQGDGPKRRMMLDRKRKLNKIMCEALKKEHMLLNKDLNNFHFDRKNETHMVPVYLSDIVAHINHPVYSSKNIILTLGDKDMQLTNAQYELMIEILNEVYSVIILHNINNKKLVEKLIISANKLFSRLYALKIENMRIMGCQNFGVIKKFGNKLYNLLQKGGKPKVKKPTKPKVKKPTKPKVKKPTKTTKPTKPNKPTKPAKPTKPTKPTKPIKPTKPTNPLNPLNLLNHLTH